MTITSSSAVSADIHPSSTVRTSTAEESEHVSSLTSSLVVIPTPIKEYKTTVVVISSVATPAVFQTDYEAIVTSLPADRFTAVMETKSAVNVTATPTVTPLGDKETYYLTTVAPSSAISSSLVTVSEVLRDITVSLAVISADATYLIPPETSTLPVRGSRITFVESDNVQSFTIAPKLVIPSVGNQYSVARVSSYAVSRTKLLLTGIPVSRRSIQVLSPSNLLKPSLSSTILPVQSSTSLNPGKGKERVILISVIISFEDWVFNNYILERKGRSNKN